MRNSALQFGILGGVYLLLCALLDIRRFNPIVVDSPSYIWIARGIARGLGFVSVTDTGEILHTHLRTPGYPLFLAPFLAMMPENLALRAAVWAQRLLWLGTVFFFGYRFAGAVAEGGRSSRRLLFAATAAALFFPVVLVNNSYVLSECLFTIVLWLSLHLLVQSVGSNALQGAIGGGFLCGAATLIRPISVILPLMLVVVVLIFSVLRRTGIRASVLVAFFAASCLLPAGWMIRNKVMFGQFSLTTVSVAYNLTMQSYIEEMPENDAVLASDPAAAAYVRYVKTTGNVNQAGMVLSRDPGMDDFKADAAAKSVFLRSVRLHPLGYLKSCAVNFVRLMSGPNDTLIFLRTLFGERLVFTKGIAEAIKDGNVAAIVVNSFCRALSVVVFVILPFIALALAGHAAWKQTATVVYLSTYAYLIVMSCMLTAAYTRYAFPLIPVVFYCCFAAAHRQSSLLKES